MNIGDRIMVEGFEPATVHALRTPSQMRARLRLLQDQLDESASNGADLAAIVIRTDDHSAA
jgi:hypothetical protein